MHHFIKTWLNNATINSQQHHLHLKADNLSYLGFIALLLLFTHLSFAEPHFVGASQCQQCHQQEYQDWQASHHFKAMQVADKNTVLGDFSDLNVGFHGIKSRLYKKGDQFLIDTANEKGETQTYPIKYTFGFHPLQQYLVETSGGHLQALNIAWDSRSKEDGGQRWYHLQSEEDISPEHPFFWTGHYQNWNSRCAECHVTNYDKGFDPKSLSYQSSWSDANVACEACHGPGSDHLKLAMSDELNGQNTGFTRRKPEPLRWRFLENQPIAHPSGETSQDHINMCGSCHSRRMQLDEIESNQDFHDGFMLELLQESSYFSDGQIEDEVFVLGSFLQSKMHRSGVTCNNCHNPHTGNIKIEGNGLCAQCHLPTEYDTPEHHHHTASSSGAQCVNCHMPARTYMGVDDRRDHSFTIPQPGLSAELGVPNACVSCHEDKENHWAKTKVNSWGVKASMTHWAQLNQRARDLDVLAAGPIAQQLQNSDFAPIVQATLLSQLSAIPSPSASNAARKWLKNKDPLIRRAAVSALSVTAPQERWQLLAPLIQDSNRQVRFTVASALAELLPQIPPSQATDLTKLVEEYREILSHTLDSPTTQLNLAGLEQSLGNPDLAVKAYQRALQIAPSFLPALVNFSEFYRGRGKVEQAEQLMAQALQVAPDSAAIQHAMGLQLIRNKNYEGALTYLERATTLHDAQPRHWYVYAIAQESTGNSKAAIQTLIKANKRWPNQYDLLLTLVLYLDKTGQTMTIKNHIANLRKIAPDSPQVQQLIHKYSATSSPE